METTKNGDQTTIYLWVLYAEYSYDNDLRQETGAHIPTVITVEGDGDYKLVEYWEPRDGYYAEDIRDKFPQHLHSAALDSQIYIDKQSTACRKAAQEHFGMISDDETSAEAAPTLSLDDVITLSQKGYDLSWVDFRDFNHIDIGSGLYIWSFEIDNRFSLRIGGGSTRGKPMYIRLRANDASDAYIDIRDGGVAEFIELHRKAPDVPEPVKYYLTVGADGVTSIELSAPGKTGGCQRADGSPFRKGEDVWLDSLDGLTDLRGVTVTALNGNGEIVWLASIPDGEENRGFTRLVQDGWTITNII